MSKFDVAAGNEAQGDDPVLKHEWESLTGDERMLKLHYSSYRLCTNYEITELMLQRALLCEGVETGCRVARYTLEIAIGRMWRTQEAVKKVKETVVAEIEKILKGMKAVAAGSKKSGVIEIRDADLDEIFDDLDYEPYDGNLNASVEPR